GVAPCVEPSLIVRLSHEKVMGRLLEPPVLMCKPGGAAVCKAGDESVSLSVQFEGSGVPSCQIFMLRVVGLVPTATAFIQKYLLAAWFQLVVVLSSTVRFPATLAAM